jgi:hypothetical protein
MGDRVTQVSRWRVVLVDGYPLAREGLRAFFAAARDLAVVGEADDAGALRVVSEAAPDLVVLGFELARGPNGVFCDAMPTLLKTPLTSALLMRSSAACSLSRSCIGGSPAIHARYWSRGSSRTRRRSQSSRRVHAAGGGHDPAVADRVSPAPAVRRR